MDIQSLLNIALSTGVGLIAWLGAQLWTSLVRLRTDMTKIEVLLPTSYVAKDELKTLGTELKDMLNRISQKLDTKADK